MKGHKTGTVAVKESIYFLGLTDNLFSRTLPSEGCVTWQHLI